MARIYNRRGAETVSHGGITYQAKEDGGFELPGDLEAHLIGFPDWETDVQRQQRFVREDLTRKRDPASALDEIAGLRADLAAALTALAKVQGTDAARPSRSRKDPAAG